MTRVIEASDTWQLMARLAAVQTPMALGLAVGALVVARGPGGGPLPVGLFGLGLGLILGTGVHEVGHALFYWRVGGRGHRVTVGHRWGLALWSAFPEPARPRFVALGGPLVPSLVGGCLWVVAAWIGSPWLTGLSIGLVVHVFGLLPGCKDGDRIWGLVSCR